MSCVPETAAGNSVVITGQYLKARHSSAFRLLYSYQPCAAPTRDDQWTEPRLQVDSPPPPTKALPGPLRSGGRDHHVQANARRRNEWRGIVAYGDDMFTTIVVWVVGLTIGYVGLRAIRTRSWSGSDRSED